jgi:tRNA(fMet)-specific endonuclease VapC
VYENLGKILVLESNPTIARQWGWLRAVRRRQPISENDGWIAATALAYDIPLVTHNRKDFLDIPGLRLITAGV